MAIGTGLGILLAGGLGAGASLYGSSQAKKAAEAAGRASQVDIDKLDEQTRRIARQNAEESAALERMLTPEVPQLRTTANQSVIGELNNDSTASARAMLESQLGSQLDTPLLREAIAKARSNLALGGTLSADIQNAVTRRSLANAGAVGGGLTLGRDITARDLGLTALDIENQRLNQAFQAGNLEQGLATDNAANLLNRINLLSQLNNSRNAFSLGAAQFGQSIAPPVVGLDPGAIAGIVGNNATNASAALSNKANIYGAQGQALTNLAGQLGGAALLAYGGYKPSNPSATTPATSLPTFNYKI